MCQRERDGPCAPCSTAISDQPRRWWLDQAIQVLQELSVFLDRMLPAPRALRTLCLERRFCLQVAQTSTGRQVGNSRREIEDPKLGITERLHLTRCPKTPRSFGQDVPNSAVFVTQLAQLYIATYGRRADNSIGTIVTLPQPNTEALRTTSLLNAMITPRP